jgi:hypothetical protein
MHTPETLKALANDKFWPNLILIKQSIITFNLLLLRIDKNPKNQTFSIKRICYSLEEQFEARDYAYRNGPPTPVNVGNYSTSYPEFDS